MTSNVYVAMGMRVGAAVGLVGSAYCAGIAVHDFRYGYDDVFIRFGALSAVSPIAGTVAGGCIASACCGFKRGLEQFWHAPHRGPKIAGAVGLAGVMAMAYHSGRDGSAFGWLTRRDGKKWRANPAY